MQSWGSAREVEKVKPMTRSEQRALRREQGRLTAQQLRQHADWLSAGFGAGPLVSKLRTAAELLDAIVKDYTPDAEGRIAQ